MKNIIFKYLFDIKSLFPTFEELNAELSTTYKNLNTFPEYIAFYLVLCPLLVTAYLTLFIVILLGFLYFLGKQVVVFLISLNTVTVTLSSIYNQDFISDMMCTILMENAKELGIIAPASIQDILPVQHTLLQTENGFTYYHFIVQHPVVEDVDFQYLSDLLNMKICQHLQVHCCNYQITYNGMPVLKVFRISESLHHPYYYSICIMLIDSEKKCSYLHKLECQKTATTVTTLTDEDF